MLQTEGPGRERPQGSLVCQSVQGQEQGTHLAAAIDWMCDLVQTTDPLWASLPCLLLRLIEK